MMINSRAPAAAAPARPRRAVALRTRAAGNGKAAAPVSRAAGLTDPAIELRDGAVVSGPDLSVTVNGVRFPNPFVIGSGPPGTNYAVMKKALDEGWGGVICKTLSLDSSKVGVWCCCVVVRFFFWGGEASIFRERGGGFFVVRLSLCSRSL